MTSGQSRVLEPNSCTADELFDVQRDGDRVYGRMPVTIASTPVPPRATSHGRAERQRPPRKTFPSKTTVTTMPAYPAGNLRTPFNVIKRLFDIVGASLLLVILAPVMVVTWVVLLITTKGRPFFCQERVGLCGRTFRMYKFRTMCAGADRLQHLVENEKDGPIFKNRRDPRVTRVGRWLRAFSIDELPQLANVLGGEMSLVGPRPAVPKEVAQYAPWQRQRLAVKPGLTCIWQISGRSEVSFENWMRMDIRYLRNQCLWLDIVLLARTPWVVLSRQGAY